MPTKVEMRLMAARAHVLDSRNAEQDRLLCQVADATAAGDCERVAALRTCVPLPRTPTNKGALGRVFGGHKPATAPAPAALALARSFRKEEGLKVAASLAAAESLRIGTKVHEAPDIAPESPTIRAVRAEDAAPAAEAEPAAEEPRVRVAQATTAAAVSTGGLRSVPSECRMALRFILAPLLLIALVALASSLCHYAVTATIPHGAAPPAPALERLGGAAAPPLAITAAARATVPSFARCSPPAYAADVYDDGAVDQCTDGHEGADAAAAAAAHATVASFARCSPPVYAADMFDDGAEYAAAERLEAALHAAGVDASIAGGTSAVIDAEMFYFEGEEWFWV